MSISWDPLSTLLQEALKNFSDEDLYLIDNDIQEMSITHQLVCYLQQSITGYAKSANEKAPGSIQRFEFDF